MMAKISPHRSPLRTPRWRSKPIHLPDSITRDRPAYNHERGIYPRFTGRSSPRVCRSGLLQGRVVSDNARWIPALHHLRGSPRDQGRQLGAMITDLLGRERRDRYLAAVEAHTRIPREISRGQSRDWFSRLPVYAQEEIEAMGAGASRSGVGRVTDLDIAEWLYADIAGGGGRCSALTVEVDGTPGSPAPATGCPRNSCAGTRWFSMTTGEIQGESRSSRWASPGISTWTRA